MRALLLVLTAVLQAAPPTAPVKTANDGFGELVYVPAGPFKMGDNFGDGESRERPVHTVDLDAFYIGKFEVTNAEFRKFRDDPGYDDPKFWPNGRPVPKDVVRRDRDAGEVLHARLVARDRVDLVAGLFRQGELRGADGV